MRKSINPRKTGVIPGNELIRIEGIHLILWVTKDLLPFLKYHRSLDGLRGEKASHFSQKYGNIERKASSLKGCCPNPWSERYSVRKTNYATTE